MWEGAGDRTETAIFWPSLLWPSCCVFLVLLMFNRRSRGPFCWVMASFTVSYQHLLWTPTHRGFPRAPSAECGFPYHISSITPSPALLQLTVERNCLLSWLSYIIVQHPLDCPLDLWNRMFDRHQVEITVMQFRGLSLLVCQSMRVSWDFFTSSHFISQFPPLRFPLMTAIRMCHFLPVHHLEWHFGPGRRSRYYIYTYIYIYIYIYIYMYVSVCVCVYMYIYTHTPTYNSMGMWRGTIVFRKSEWM